jgi:hypothetical protein
MKTKYTELSQKLDDIISLAQKDDDETFPYKRAAGAAVGTAGTAGVGYGLYRRGRALGDVAGTNLGMVHGPLPASLRSKGVTRGAYSTAEGRRVLGNVIAGAEALPSDVGRFARQTAQQGSLLLHPSARAAIGHDVRSSLAARLAKLAAKIHP